MEVNEMDAEEFDQIYKIGESDLDEDQLKPRAYQTYLEEIAVKRNTIIYLPTGSGKTFIAIQLIKRFRDALQKPWGDGGKRTFFLVNNVPLVLQQKKVIEKSCPVKGVGAYSGEDNVDFWDKQKWDEELSKHQVIVMTCQILADMISHQYVDIKDINLIIFDECHHAVENHPMRVVMKHFVNCPREQQPRVIGLTATLLNSNVKTSKVIEVLRDLETTFHGTIATDNELGEALYYGTNPSESIQFYKSPVASSAAQEAMVLLLKLENKIRKVKLPQVVVNPTIKLQRFEQDISNDPKKIVKAVSNMILDMKLFIEELGVYSGSLAILAYTILLERLKRKVASKEEELLYTIVITESINVRYILLRSMENETGYDKIVKHSSEQILKLLKILQEYNPINRQLGVTYEVNRNLNDLSGIIFTRRRFTAKVLYNLLKDVKETNHEQFGFLKHDFIVGFNINPMKCTREQHSIKKTNEVALLKFRNKELNCLISTSVIEEGTDIPQCALVVLFDPPLEYRSYIQSKGRTRSELSSYVILKNVNDRTKFLNQYHNFQIVEEYIRNILKGNKNERLEPSQMDIQRNLYDEDDIPPYVTPYGSRLFAVTATSLLYRYCSVLPRDIYTLISPMWILEKIQHRDSQMNLVKVILPIASPIKEVILGQPMKNLKSAKSSTALNACIRLYEEGELDSVTLLPRIYGTVDFDELDVASCFPNWPTNGTDDESNLPKPGTKNRIRKHDKVFPSYLEGLKNWKSGNQTFYLHIIQLTTAFEKPKEPREQALYKLLQRGEGFGLLTSQALPTICDFPLFLTVGEVGVSLKMNYAVIPLNLSLFDLVKRFHFFIFNQVLGVAKKFLVFDGTVNAMYAVPVKYSDGYDIDWDVMQEHNEIPPPVMPSYEERTSLHVTQEDYQYSVVTPWYRATILPDRYIVSNVLEYMTPKSHFDTESYSSYEEYYKNRYNLEVVGPKHQPLLEVRSISSRMNCLLPRAATIRTFTGKQQKLISEAQGDDKPKGFAEIFIPEFCIKYNFPGVLWYKAMMLPGILHRIYMLLVALELRAEITKNTGYGQTILPKGEKWLPIKIKLSIAKKSLLSQVEEPANVNTVDRINNPIDDDSPRPKNILPMKESLYHLQKKKINMQYPWDETLEPLDIERNISIVTVMDIECYDEFYSTKMTTVEEKPRTVRNLSYSAAILPSPSKHNDKINILTKKPVGRGPELRDVLTALTTINSHDTFNLEQMETLGDSFLKFAASLYLYHKFPKLNEGQLTNIKGRLIGNRNLYYAGEKAQIGGRMKVEQFIPREDFLVPGFFAPKEIQKFMENAQIRPTFLIGMEFSQSEALSGKLTQESQEQIQRRYSENNGAAELEPVDQIQHAMQCYVRKQTVSDKSVADCVEALIGTYLSSGGILAAVKVLEWLRVLPWKDNFSQMLNKRVSTVLQEEKATVKDIDFLLYNCRADIQDILNYKFKDPSLLLEALSHSSYIRNRFTRSYERLEFIGDAILDFLITSYLFENYPDLNPGELTDLRSALVNNVTFASYVVKLGLHKFILKSVNSTLDGAIITFIEHQQQRDHKIEEDVLHLIDEEDCQIAEYVEVPKILSDIFESLAGAIYLDSGGNLEAVWSVIYPIMCREIDLFSARIPKQPVRILYEMVHACPMFGNTRLAKTGVPKVMVPVTVTKNGCQHTVYGFGRNKFQAKRAAAKLALKVLGE